MPKPVLVVSLMLALPIIFGHAARAAEPRQPDDAPTEATQDAARDLVAARAANARAQHEGRSSVWMLKAAPKAVSEPSTADAPPRLEP